MKITYILERFPGGTLNFVYNEIRCLEAAGVQVSIHSLHAGGDCPAEARAFVGRTEVVLPATPVGMLRAWLHYALRKPLVLFGLLATIPWDNEVGTLRKAIKSLGHVAYGVYFAWLMRDRPDHIHAHFAFKAATAALVAARLNGTTFSFTAHGSATAHPPSRYALRTKVREAGFVVAVSEFNRDVMLGLCPEVEPDRIFVNRTGVLLDQFPLRNPCGPRGDGPKRILCVATLYPIKNHEGLTRAFAEVVESAGIDAELHLVGRDDVGIGDRVRELAAGLGIADRIVMHGAVDHGDVVGLLAEADLVVLASFSEGVPVSLMEAMAVGVPVVGPRVTGVPELVEDGQAGLLVDPHDPGSIAAAMAAALGDEHEAAARAGVARRKIEKDYDMAANARALAEEMKRRLRRES